MVRELASYDVSRYGEILRWPLAEALLAYEHRLRAQAQHAYDLRLLGWYILVQSGATKRKRPPALPAILQDEEV